MSRREFMFGASALALGGLAAHEGNAEAQENKEVERCLEDAFQYNHQEIDFQGPYAEITPELGSLLKKIISLQEGRNLSPGTQMRSEEKELPVNHNQEKIKELWPHLSALIPDLPPYSLPNSVKVFLYEIPKFLARYGIAARIVLAPYYDLKQNRIHDISFLCNFFKITKVDSDTITDEQQNTIKRNVVYVNDELKVDGKNINNRQLGSAGHTGFKTIFLREEGLARDFEAIKESWDMFSDAQYDVPADTLSAKIRANKNPEKAAWLMALLGLCRKIKSSALTRAMSDNQTIAHETGHLFSEFNADFGARVLPHAPLDNAPNFFRGVGNFMAHDEIEGNIGALQFGNEKILALFDVIGNNVTNKGDTDYGHASAARWVLEAITDELVSNAGEYGISLNPSAPLSLKCQAILKLVDIVERPELITALAKRIKEKHAQHFTDDLGSDYVKINKIQEKIDKDQASARVDLYKKIGVVGTLVLGAGAGLNWLRERQRRVQRMENIRKAKEKKDRQGGKK